MALRMLALGNAALWVPLVVVAWSGDLHPLTQVYACLFVVAVSLWRAIGWRGNP